MENKTQIGSMVTLDNLSKEFLEIVDKTL